MADVGQRLGVVWFEEMAVQWWGMGIGEHDDRLCYCRTLGHEVPFGYCREVSEGLPCKRLLDCWFEQFPIEGYLREHYSDEQIAEIFTPPQAKLTSLVQLIEEARKRAAESED